MPSVYLYVLAMVPMHAQTVSKQRIARVLVFLVMPPHESKRAHEPLRFRLGCHTLPSVTGRWNSTIRATMPAMYVGAARHPQPRVTGVADRLRRRPCFEGGLML